jgi:hypothetical protein
MVNGTGTKFDYQLKRGDRARPQLDRIAKAAIVTHGDYQIEQYENGTIIVSKNGAPQAQAKPALREIAKELGVSLLNGNGNPMNTRSLGAAILSTLNQSE